MKIGNSFFKLSVIILIASFGCAELPDEPEKLTTGQIIGRVTDEESGSGISGATIRTNPATQTTTTSTNGDYTLTNISFGSYIVFANKDGYEENNVSVIVEAGSNNIADIKIKEIFVCGTSVVKYEGETYGTVKIGNQCWLKKNLNIGTRIDGSQNQTNNETIEKYCYDNLETNCDKYGGLYQWDEAMKYATTEGTQGICPEGWHIPSLSELELLKINAQNNGNSLKAIGEGNGAGAGTNTTNFSALLAGFINYDTFESKSLNMVTFFNSSTESEEYDKIYGIFSMYLLADSTNIEIFSKDDKRFGNSIRCIMD